MARYKVNGNKISSNPINYNIIYKNYGDFIDQALIALDLDGVTKRDSFLSTYVDRPVEENEVVKYINNDDPIPLAIKGKVGIGKTTLLKKIRHTLSDSNPEIKFFVISYNGSQINKPIEYFTTQRSDRTYFAQKLVKEHLANQILFMVQRFYRGFDDLEFYDFLQENNFWYLNNVNREIRKRALGQNTDDMKYNMLDELRKTDLFKYALLLLKYYLISCNPGGKVVLIFDNFDLEDVHIQSALVFIYFTEFIRCLNFILSEDEKLQLKTIIAARPYTFRRAETAPGTEGYYINQLKFVNLDEPPNLNTILKKRFDELFKIKANIGELKLEFIDEKDKSWSVDIYKKYLDRVCDEFKKQKFAQIIYSLNNSNIRLSLMSILQILKNPQYLKLHLLIPEVVVDNTEAETTEENISEANIYKCLGYGGADCFPVENTPIKNILCSGYKNNETHDFVLLRIINILLVTEGNRKEVTVPRMVDILNPFYSNEIVIDVLGNMFDDLLIATELNRRPNKMTTCRLWLDNRGKLLFEQLHQSNLLLMMFHDDSWLPSDHTPIKSTTKNYEEQMRISLTFLTYIYEREKAELERFKSESNLFAFRQEVGDQLISELVLTGVNCSYDRFYKYKLTDIANNKIINERDNLRNLILELKHMYNGEINT